MSEQVVIVILAIALHIMIETLSNNHICPSYCEVDHEHMYRDN